MYPSLLEKNRKEKNDYVGSETH